MPPVGGLKASSDPGTGPGAPTLQSLLDADGTGPVVLPPHPAGPARPAAAADPVTVLRRLESAGRFHRDSGLGRVFHPGRSSFRENVPTNSLHVVVDGNRLAAHVDRVSPLGADAGGPPGYSLRRAVVHNLVGMAEDVIRVLRGRQGDHRCELNCEWDPDAAAPAATGAGDGLLDPGDSSWSVQMEARVAGSLDEARLRAALRRAVDAPEGWDGLEVLHAADDGALDQARARLHRTGVPADARPPLRAVLARCPGGDVVMLNLNHAAADAFGALEVLRAVARAYAGDAGAGPVEILAGRRLPFRPAPGLGGPVTRAYKRGVERLRDLLTRPARLAPDGAGDEPGYGFHLVSLTPEQTGRILVEGRPGTSRNMLMAAFHLAIGDWNLHHGGPGRRVGVLAAVNLRPPGWDQRRLGNFSVTARISTTRRQRARPATALEAVAGHTTRNQRTRTGIALMAALDRAGLLPLWVMQSVVVLRPVTHHRFVDTGMLCNLGSVEAPDFGPEAGATRGLWCSTPARSPLTLVLGAVAAGGRLHLSFRYPDRLLGPAAVRRFAACYLRNLEAVAAEHRHRRRGA